MLGLALEGGGAKGAYEIGAYRALTELGYRFDVICGVSIGAINAALLAQGDCDRAAEFWETMSNDDLFSEKDKGFLEVINRQVNLNTLSALKENIKTALENGGIDTSRIRAFLEQNIDPERLLASPVDYGMIAVAFPTMCWLPPPSPASSRLPSGTKSIWTAGFLMPAPTMNCWTTAAMRSLRSGSTALVLSTRCGIKKRSDRFSPANRSAPSCGSIPSPAAAISRWATTTPCGS